MLNLLMVENDFEKFKYLLNTISNFDLDLRLYNLSITGEEAIDVINAYNIDLILLDSNITDMNIFKLLHIIEQRNKYKNSVIFISNNKLSISELECFSCINCIINDVTEIELIEDSLAEIIINFQKKEKELKEKIQNELKYLKYNLFHKGTTYLCESIYQLYLIQSYNVKLKKIIYPIIAYKYDTTVNNVKSNIIRASIHSFIECEEKKLSDYLGKDIIEKPNTIDIMLSVIKHID